MGSSNPTVLLVESIFVKQLATCWIAAKLNLVSAAPPRESSPMLRSRQEKVRVATVMIQSSFIIQYCIDRLTTSCTCTTINSGSHVDFLLGDVILT
jgi:hypothetical protein